MGKYIILIGEWIGKVEADTDMKAKTKGIALYKKETDSKLKVTDLLPYTFPRRVKERDTTLLQILEERSRKEIKR